MAKKQIRQSDHYVDFLSSLDPITIALTDGTFSVDRLAYLKSEKDSLKAELRSKLGKMSDDFFDVTSSLSLLVSGQGKSKPVVRISASYEIHFHANHVTKQNVERFIESELTFVVWPYFRELVSNTAARMHIPPIILPISGKREADPAKSAAR